MFYFVVIYLLMDINNNSYNISQLVGGACRDSSTAFLFYLFFYSEFVQIFALSKNMTGRPPPPRSPLQT